MRPWFIANKWLVLIISGGFLTFFATNNVLADGDPAAGQAKAGVCFGCHGPDGNSPIADFPRLAGQYQNYIVKQLRDFQTTKRANNDIMAGMAATVASVEDAKDIGAYFQSQQLADQPITPPPSREVLEKGERLYVQGDPDKGVYGCVNCHGPQGRGRAPDISQFPVLGAQHRDFLVKQLKDFREGRRANDPAGMMSDIASKLSDEEIMAVAEYLANVPPPNRKE